MASARRTAALDALRRAKATGVGAGFPFPVGKDLSTMVRQFRLDYDVSGAVVCAMMLACRQIDPERVRGQDPEPDNYTVETVGEDGTTSTQTNPDAVRELARADFLRNVKGSEESAMAWLRDLVMCHQVSPLNESNAHNYFLALNGTEVNGRDVIMVLEVAKNLLEKLVDLEDIRDAATNIEFIAYHISYASTQGLVKRMLDDLKGFLPVSDNTIGLVEHACMNFWDREAINAIPTRVVAMTHAYLSVMDMLPSNWYQGRKAVQATSPILYARWTQVFRAYRRVKTEAAALDAARSERDILAAAGEGVMEV